MASFVVMQESVGKYYICMENILVYNSTIWQVTLNEKYSDRDIYHTIREMTYSYDNKKNAMATYNRYVRKAKEMTA